MKGILLCGGTGSRLGELCRSTNKHLLPVGNVPMVYHSINKLKDVGIRDILIVTGTEHMGAMVSTLGSGTKLNCRFTYKVQDQAGGIAEALGLARDFTGTEKMVVILGDNIFEDSLELYVNNYIKSYAGCRLLLKKVHDPQRYGVANIDVEEQVILSIEEKPKEPKSDMAVTGIYMYDQKVYSIIDNIKPSARGELEITDVNNWYIERGEAEYDIFKGYWTDAGTLESYQYANQLVNEKR